MKLLAQDLNVIFFFQFMVVSFEDLCMQIKVPFVPDLQIKRGNTVTV